MTRRRWPVRAWLVLAVALVAATTLIVVIVWDSDGKGELRCLAVDQAVTDRIASRPRTGPVVPVTAMAVRARDIEKRTAHYYYEAIYVIAMRFTGPGGEVAEGTWGLGSNISPPENQSTVTVGGPKDGSAINTVDEAARKYTTWPPGGEITVEEDGHEMLHVLNCLADK